MLAVKKWGRESGMIKNLVSRPVIGQIGPSLCSHWSKYTPSYDPRVIIPPVRLILYIIFQFSHILYTSMLQNFHVSSPWLRMSKMPRKIWHFTFSMMNMARYQVLTRKMMSAWCDGACARSRPILRVAWIFN